MKKKKYKSRHHIVPTSRSYNNSPRNIAIIDTQKHNDYHRLFYNMLPSEIIVYLVEYFWNNNWEYVEDAFSKAQENEMMRRC